jgi:hypothetical protein
MFEHRGRPHPSSPRGKGAAAVSGRDRLLVGAVVNLAVVVAWAAEALDGRRNEKERHYSSQCAADGGTSRAGLRSKKPTGASRNPVDSTGWTG